MKWTWQLDKSKDRYGKVALPSHWLFQGLFYMDATERLFKLGLDLLGTIVFAILLASFLPAPSALLFGFLAAHSLNFFFNGQLWVALRFYGLVHVSGGAFDRYLAGLAGRLRAEPSLQAAYVCGSFVRGEWHASSDLDLRLLRRPGAVNGLRACWFLLTERSRAVLARFPLDAYVIDRVESLEKVSQAERGFDLLIENSMDLDLSNEPRLSMVRGCERYIRQRLFVSEAIYFYLNTLAVTGLGALFWLGATRLYAPGMVGLAVVLLSTAQIITTLAQFGLGYYVIRFLPVSGDEGKALVNFVLTISLLNALILGIGVLWVAPLLAVPLRSLHRDPSLSASFLLFTVTTTAVQISLAILAALRAGRTLLAINVLASLGRLFLLVFVFQGYGAAGILLSFSLPLLVALFALLFFIFPRRVPGFHLRPDVDFRNWPFLRSYSLSNFFSNLLHDLPYQVYPILVARFVGLVAVAYFYVCWNLFSLIVTLSSSISLSLFVEGAYDRRSAKTIAGRTLFFTASSTAVIAVFASLFSPSLLSLFGQGYRVHASPLLAIIAFAAIPASIVYLRAALLRVEMRTVQVIIAYGWIALISLGLGSLALSQGGLSMIGWVWLLAQLSAAVYITCAARSRSP